MTLRFSSLPGRHERQLQRIHLNPLFNNPAVCVSREQLHEARRQDAAEAKRFEQDFVSLVQRVTALQANEQSDVILDIKEKLDKSYEQASGLQGDQTTFKQAIVKLVGVIMQAVRRGAQGDSKAGKELDDEEAARDLHYHLLEYSLVADILAPDSTLGAEHLLPGLLSSPTEELEAALGLFDREQLESLLSDSRRLLETLDQNIPQLDSARLRLLQIERHLTMQDTISAN